jgi:hypothetical protein
MAPSEVSKLFEHVNHTELFQICQKLGISVSAATPRETLIGYLSGDIELPENARNVIDEWRHGLMGFLLDHWQVVRSQLECPAKSGDPLACFQCVDPQVITCIVDNPQNEKLIELKRKK